jgi:predicted NUDIX family NTP pyrophosphohydrolase
MAARRSAGIVLYRVTESLGLEVWIAHMGGPFWSKRDAGAWSIPKGEISAIATLGHPGGSGASEPGESEIEAALREFEEEIGSPPPDVPYVRLGEFVQSSGKVVVAFAAESDFSVARVVSNTFSLEWPRNSGRLQEFPEMDDARWVPAAAARDKLVKGQAPILDALETLLRDPNRR